MECSKSLVVMDEAAVGSSQNTLVAWASSSMPYGTFNILASTMHRQNRFKNSVGSSTSPLDCSTHSYFPVQNAVSKTEVLNLLGCSSVLHKTGFRTMVLTCHLHKKPLRAGSGVYILTSIPSDSDAGDSPPLLIL